jgi:hypothetical protein
MKPIPATEKRSRKAKLTIVEQRHATDGKPTKTAQLAQAGLSSTANRYEKLAGGREEHAQKTAKQAANTRFRLQQKA